MQGWRLNEFQNRHIFSLLPCLQYSSYFESFLNRSLPCSFVKSWRKRWWRKLYYFLCRVRWSWGYRDALLFGSHLELSQSYTGSSVARFAGQNVYRRPVQEESYQQQNYEDAMRRSFLRTDEDMFTGAHYSSSGWPRKTTKFLLYERFIFSWRSRYLAHDRTQANAGDSGVVLSMKGQVKPLSFDYKPGNKYPSSLVYLLFVLLTWSIVDRKCILAARGYIEFGHVNG